MGVQTPAGGGGSALSEAALEGEEVEVPAARVVDDPRELDLIGDGLPIIHGVRIVYSFCGFCSSLQFWQLELGKEGGLL
jgi:hypothetical protein